MNPSETFQITEFTNPRTGSISFRVNGMLDGKQVRKNRSTMAEAISLKQDLERQVMNMEPLPAVTTRLTNDQAAEAETAFRMLRGKPFGLIEAVTFATRNWTTTEKAILVPEAVTLFIKSKTEANKRSATIRTLTTRLKLLTKAFPNHKVHELQTDQITPLIFREDSGLVNRDSDYRAFTNFFNWAVAEGYRESSPMARITKIKLESGEPEALTMENVRRLVAAAESYKGGILVPYVTLCLFCGIRPDREASRITWADIKLQSKIIKIGADVAKMRGRRVVDIPDNAVEFLTPHADKKTPLKGKNWRKDFDAVKRLAGFGTMDKEHIAFSRWPKDKLNEKPLCYCAVCCKQRKVELKEWTSDVMRHTAISYHLALHNDEDKTATWAGNSPEIVHNKYKALIEDKKDVADFWNILPGTCGKVLDLAA